jgi:general L-amino acid transport system permease protein
VALTFIALDVIYLLLPPILNWTFFDLTADNQSCGREGTYWSFIDVNLKMFIYGLLPTRRVMAHQYYV